MKEQFFDISNEKYGVLLKAIERLMSSANAYEKNSPKKTDAIIIAIDGNCCAGKATLANALGLKYGASVFHMDDFFLRKEQRTKERYLQPGGNVDRERFEKEILKKLKSKQSMNYSRFDCKKMELTDSILIDYKNINIVEGAYSTHPDLISYYDLTVFMKMDPVTQRERILTRNGIENAGVFFDRWIPLENMAFKTFDSENRCDIIIDESKDWRNDG